MKSKLLLTSALASSVLLSGAAFAETKIGGNLEQTYRAVSGSDTSNTGLSDDGIGSQSMITISKTADLDNGMSLKAGVNYENDGDAHKSDTEYLEITSGMFMFRLGQDGGHASTSTTVPFVGDSAETAGAGITYLKNGINGIIDEIHEAPNFSITAELPFGTKATARYAPNSDAGEKAADSGIPDNEWGSGQEYVVTSSPIEGLTVQAGYQYQELANTNNTSTTESGTNSYVMYGAKYNFGNVTVGATFQSANDGTSSSTAPGGNDIDTEQFGIAFAVNDNMSIGIHTGKAETVNNSTDRDEKVQGIGVGYNLGGLGLEVTYVETETVTSGTDYDALQIRTVQKF